MSHQQLKGMLYINFGPTIKRKIITTFIFSFPISLHPNNFCDGRGSPCFYFCDGCASLVYSFILLVLNIYAPFIDYKKKKKNH